MLYYIQYIFFINIHMLAFLLIISFNIVLICHHVLCISACVIKSQVTYVLSAEHIHNQL